MNNQPYNEKADIWSLGVLLFLMIDRTCKYAEKHKSLRLYMNSQNWVVNYCSLETKSLMKKMLNKNVEERLSVEMCKEEINMIISDMKAKGKVCSLPSQLLMISNEEKFESMILERSI